MKKFTLLIFWLHSIFFWGQSGKLDADAMMRRLDRAFFIENKGQWPEEVLYLARPGGLNVWITRDGMVMDFHRVERDESKERPWDKFDVEKESKGRLYGQMVRMRWVGSGKPRAEGQTRRIQLSNKKIFNA